MPYGITWDNPEKTVVYLSFSGKLTLEEYYASASAYQELARTVANTVHLIVDSSDLTGYPPGMLTAGRNMSRRRPANQGVIVAVKFNPFLRGLLVVLGHLMPELKNRICFADSLPQARQLIAH